MRSGFWGRWWETGRYGCQNDGLDELDMMEKEGGRKGGRNRRRDRRRKGKGGREGERARLPNHAPRAGTVHLFQIKLGVLDGHPGSSHGEVGEASLEGGREGGRAGSGRVLIEGGK